MGHRRYLATGILRQAGFEAARTRRTGCFVGIAAVAATLVQYLMATGLRHGIQAKTPVAMLLMLLKEARP